MFGNSFVHRSEMTPERWIDTSFARTDGREEFRERPKFGNRHAIFEKDSEWGEVHYDNHNALDFPGGTVNHISQYTNERTGLPEGIVKTALILGGLYAGYKILKYLGEDEV